MFSLCAVAPRQELVPVFDGDAVLASYSPGPQLPVTNPSPHTALFVLSGWKRWAASKGEAESPSKTATAKPKRKMSAAGRKAISDATKKRWEAFHAAKKAEKPAVAKKTAPKKAVAKKAVKAPAKAARRAPVKKAVTKKTAPAAAQAGTETAAQ